MSILEFIKSLYYRARGTQELVGAERVQAVIGHFQDDIVSLRTGLNEMAGEDADLLEQQEELNAQRGEIRSSTIQTQKLLEGLNALLGV